MSDPDTIPRELLDRPQWVVWKYEHGTKVPYNARTGSKASSTNPGTWASYETARQRYERGGFDGVGYVFAADDPFCGVDLDDCLNADGKAAPWAVEIINKLDSYTEISPSGLGVKIWVEGDLPSNIGATPYGSGGIEMYDRARYFTVTGRRFDHAPIAIRNVNGEIKALHAKITAIREQKDAPAEPNAAKVRETAYLAKALRGILDDIAAATKGARNDTFNDLCYRAGKFVGRGMLLRSDAEAVLEPAGIATGLTRREVRSTMRSGLNGGVRDAHKLNLPDFEQRSEPQEIHWSADGITAEIIETPNGIITQYPGRIPDAPLDFHDLMAMDLQPIRWFAPGFFREGFGVLAGEANVGKTPLLIQLAIALASGDLWMNKVQCAPAKVLFIGTEYTQNELAYVIASSAAGRKPPRGRLTFKCVREDQTQQDIAPATAAEAHALIEYYLREEHYDVIIIDVLTGFLPEEGFKQNVYRGDYKEFKPYHILGLRYHALILGSWHTVKREGNPRYMYNGSSGLWSVPASRVTLYADQEQRIRLFSMPRFEQKTDWALAKEQSLQGMRWVVSDAAPEPVMSDAELAIWRFLKQHATKTRAIGPATIAEMTGVPIGTVKSAVRRMYEKNLLQQTAGSSGYFVEEAATDATTATVSTAATGATRLATAELPHCNGLNCPGCNGCKVFSNETVATTNLLDATDENTPSYSLDQVQVEGGETFYRVYRDDINQVVATFPTEAAALQFVEGRQ